MLENAVHLFRVAVSLDLTGWKRHGKGWKLDILLIKLEVRDLIALNSRHGVDSGFDSVVIFSILRTNADFLSPETSRHTSTCTYITFLDFLQAKHDWELKNGRFLLKENSNPCSSLCVICSASVW